MPFRFFGSSHAEAAQEETEREDTQVTKLMKELDDKIEKSRETMDETCSKADELGERLTRPGSYPKLKAVLSSPPPPSDEEEPGTTG